MTQTVHSRPILSSLYPRNTPHRSSSSRPLSSVSTSPDGSYAVASGRDVLHVLRLGEKLEEIRSVRISQHFQAPQPTTPTASRSQYPHVHDVLNASTPSVPTPTAGGGANVTITAVAWSKEQPYLVDRGFDGSPGEGTELEEEEGHYPSFVKRVRIKNTQRVDDSSIVAAGGSNGVVVAWNAHSALLGDTASNQSGLFHKSRVEPSVTASIGQPEAVFLAHSRAVNRLAWHPGHRPYLLLTASQDGTVKLWDRRASSSAISKTSAQQKSWFHFGHSQLPSRTIVQTSNNWHCISTYTPKCEAVRDIKWNPHLQDVFAMVSDNGTLCVYDIRLNRPVMKTTSHGGEATSVDWHPSEKYVLATGGGRDRCVKVWDIESALNIHKADETVPIVSNSGSYLSDYTSESGHSEQVKLEDDGRNTPQLTTHTIGSTSPIKRNASGLALSRSMHYKSYSPVHTLFVSSPITSLCWRPNTGETESLGDSIVAVATSPIQGANAGGNGTIGLWACKYPFVPISVVEGHEEGAVTAFTFVDISSVPGTTAYNRSSSQPAIPLASHHEPLQQFSKRNSDQNVATMSRIFRESALRSIVLSVGRDGQCLLQDFSLGEQPILQVPKCTFALANLSPFQPGFGSLQLLSVQNTQRHHNASLVFSVTDQGDAEDLTASCQPKYVDVSPELTHLSRFSEHYETMTGNRLAKKSDLCRHNANVAGGLNRKALANMWTTLAIILEGSDDMLPTNPNKKPQSALSFLLVSTLQNLLLQRANAGDVQTCVVLCEVMDVILPPAEVGGVAKSALPDVGIDIIREWYLSYIDLLQQMCLFTQAASLIRNCNDPIIGALNQQSTTISESCPICSKPLLGGTTVDDTPGASRRHMSQRVCKSCRGRIGLCFICHEPVKGIFVWCPGCGHGGHLDHALEWFGTSEVCPTGCGHKCNLFPASTKR